MPNGGSDCCGTCWFNSNNDGDPKMDRDAHTLGVKCTLRGVEIEDPFWTYCTNHPHHNPSRIEVPIGPIFTNDGGGFPYGRKPLVESPDSEEIRMVLLGLLDTIQERPDNEYPTSPKRDEMVITQLGEFREARAIAGLERILRFDPQAEPEGENPFQRNRIPTIAQAIYALAQIQGDASEDWVRLGLSQGLEAARALNPYDYKSDSLGMIRYWSAQALERLSARKKSDIISDHGVDPAPDIAELLDRLCDQS